MTIILNGRSQKNFLFTKGKKLAYKLIDLLKQEQEENTPIQEDVKKLVRERINHAKQHREEMLDWETAKKRTKVVK